LRSANDDGPAAVQTTASTSTLPALARIAQCLHEQPSSHDPQRCGIVAHLASLMVRNVAHCSCMLLYMRARTHPRTCITHARATCLFASSLGDTGALAFLGPPCCSPLHPSHLLCAEWRGHALGRACPLKRVCAVGRQTTSGALVSIKEQALISQIWYRTVQCTRPPAHSRAPTSPGRPATPDVQRDRRVGVFSACCAAARSIHQQ
jgi:hypothetical protein